MWLPRRVASLGEPSEQPDGDQVSRRSAAYAVKARPFVRIASMFASATSAMPHLRGRQTDDAGRADLPAADPTSRPKAGPISNWSVCAIQPWIGGQRRLQLASHVQERGPGPPFRYL